MEELMNAVERRKQQIERRNAMIRDVVNLKKEDPDLKNWQIAEMLHLPESTVRNIIIHNM